MANETVPSALSVASLKSVAALMLAVAEKEIFAPLILSAQSGLGSVASDVTAPLLLDPPSVAELTDGTQYATNTAITATSMTATIKEIGLRAEITDASVEDLGIGQNGQLEAGTIATFSNSISTGVDATLLGMIASLTTNVESQSGVALDKTIWQNMILQMRNSLAHGYGDDFMAVLSPTQYSSLSKSLDDASTYGGLGEDILMNLGKAMRANYVGAPYGVNTWITTNVQRTSSDWNGVMFVPEAFYYGIKRDTRVEKARVDPGDRANTIVVTKRFAYAEKQDALAGRILSI